MSSRTKLSCNAAMLVCSVALAGCVGVQVEEVLASTASVAELQRENGALVEAARFSAGRAGEAPPGGWSPFVVSPFATKSEEPLGESKPRTLLAARAPPPPPPPGPPPGKAPGGVLFFSPRGAGSRPDPGEQNTLRLYKALTG